MSKSMSEIASELLMLEQTQKSRAFDEQEQERWEELVIQIFGEKPGDGPKRRSFRLRSNTKGVILFGKAKYDCEILELSLRGFSFYCPFLKNQTSDFLLILESIDVLDEKVFVELECKTVNVRTIGGQDKFGAVVTSGNSSERLGNYADEVYYPFYLSYLKGLATENF